MFNISETTAEMEAAAQPILEPESSNSVQVTDIHAENNYLFGATNEPFHNEINSTIKTWSVNETENGDLFSKYPPGLLQFGAICVITFAVFGVLGNFISILAFSRCIRLRNATTAFVVNLCVADLLFCSTTMPLSVVQFFKGSRYLGEALCKLYPILLYSNTFVSLFSVVAITVNRYILVVHPRIYPSVYRKRNTAIMIALIWLIPFLLLMIPLLEIWGSLGYDPNILTCSIVKLDGTSPNEFLFILGFGLPFIAFPICYIRIFFAVRKASKRAIRHSNIPNNCTPHRDRKELRVLRVMLAMVILYFVCYFSAFFMNIYYEEPYPKYLNIFTYIGVYFTNIMNPAIYAVMSKEYRKAYEELLFC